MSKFTQSPNTNKKNFKAFLKGFRKYEKEKRIKKLRDKFLDAYSLWLKNATRKNKLKVLNHAIKLDKIDDYFHISNLFSEDN